MQGNGPVLDHVAGVDGAAAVEHAAAAAEPSAPRRSDHRAAHTSMPSVPKVTAASSRSTPAAPSAPGRCAHGHSGSGRTSQGAPLRAPPLEAAPGRTAPAAPRAGRELLAKLRDHDAASPATLKRPPRPLSGVAREVRARMRGADTLAHPRISRREFGDVADDCVSSGAGVWASTADTPASPLVQASRQTGRSASRGCGPGFDPVTASLRLAGVGAAACGDRPE
jgi:hypothetical protein